MQKALFLRDSQNKKKVDTRLSVVSSNINTESNRSATSSIASSVFNDDTKYSIKDFDIEKEFDDFPSLQEIWKFNEKIQKNPTCMGVLVPNFSYNVPTI